MIWLAILHLSLSGQEATSGPRAVEMPVADIPVAQAVSASRDRLYAAPRVRPFEPPSDFGREPAQGDADNQPHRRPIRAPVVVNGYLHSYEVSLSDGEIAYAQGVAQAEIDADAHMGSLDGRWRVVAADGVSVLSLVLSDAGEDVPVEGAWRRPQTPGLSGDLGVIADVDRSLRHLNMTLEATPGYLNLAPAANGQWVGILTEDGQSRAVVLQRPG